MFGKKTNRESYNLTVLEEADWILPTPILNILGCFELEMPCLNLTYRKNVCLLCQSQSQQINSNYRVLYSCQSKLISLPIKRCNIQLVDLIWKK